MKISTIILLFILSYCLGLVTLQPSIVSLLLSIDWAHQRVGNIAALIASGGTLAAVITALWQSHQAEIEAEKNRNAAIEATKERATIYNNILISPPDFIKFSIGITITNSGRVPIHLQGVSCFCKNISTHILITNEMLDLWSVKFNLTLAPGSKATVGINYKFLMHIARYAVEFCNGNASNMRFSISSNLETFESKLNQEIVDRANKLINCKKTEIEKQISESSKGQKNFESEKEDDKWLELYK